MAFLDSAAVMKNFEDCEKWAVNQTAHMMIGQALQQPTPALQKSKLADCKRKFESKKINITGLQVNLEEKYLLETKNVVVQAPAPR